MLMVDNDKDIRRDGKSKQGPVILDANILTRKISI